MRSVPPASQRHAPRSTTTVIPEEGCWGGARVAGIFRINQSTNTTDFHERDVEPHPEWQVWGGGKGWCRVSGVVVCGEAGMAGGPARVRHGQAHGMSRAKCALWYAHRYVAYAISPSYTFIVVNAHQRSDHTTTHHLSSEHQKRQHTDHAGAPAGMYVAVCKVQGYATASAAQRARYGTGWRTASVACAVQPRCSPMASAYDSSAN